MGKKKYTEQILLNEIKRYYEEHDGMIRPSDFKATNGYPPNSVYRRKFGSFYNAIKLAEAKLTEKQIERFEKFNNCESSSKKYTKQECIDILIDYYHNVEFPTIRKFTEKNNLPSYNIYYLYFGSFKNAILISGITIPTNRKRYFDRNSLSDKEMLELLKYYTEEKLKNNIYLLTYEDIDKIPNMPHTTTYVNRFGSVKNAYNLINIDYDKFNKEALEKDMVKKYLELIDEIGHLPNSREIEKASKSNDGYYYAMKTYETHFGSLSSFQKQLGFTPTYCGRSKDNNELLNDLKHLANKINRMPIQYDVDESKWMASSKVYVSRFGSFITALELIGFDNAKEKYNIYITKQGNECLSKLEYSFCTMLENSNFDFTKEEHYRKYIIGLKRRYRFDFTIFYNDKIYFIEIFGMVGRKDYNQKTKDKIKLCNKNNLNLIDLYPKDIYGKSEIELYKILINKINNLENQNNNIKEAI